MKYYGKSVARRNRHLSTVRHLLGALRAEGFNATNTTALGLNAVFFFYSDEMCARNRELIESTSR